MRLPLFYIENIDTNKDFIVLDEDTSRHVVSVLRMKVAEKLHITDGKGNLLTVEIVNDHKKKCETKIIDLQFTHPHHRKISIGISLLKNATRLEWFLEKATEIGVAEIIPLICERTERQRFRYDRMKAVLISAMLQSQQCWLPLLQGPLSYNDFMDQTAKQDQYQQKFIAHCMEEEKRNLADQINKNISTQIILIGPEGDFTKQEIDLALQHHFIPVALGETRLRTETAGVVAAVLLKTGR
jgi:16S rRNA (uracil1498-N3)-methyltransferase